MNNSFFNKYMLVQHHKDNQFRIPINLMVVRDSGFRVNQLFMFKKHKILHRQNFLHLLRVNFVQTRQLNNDSVLVVALDIVVQISLISQSLRLLSFSPFVRLFIVMVYFHFFRFLKCALRKYYLKCSFVMGRLFSIGI